MVVSIQTAIDVMEEFKIPKKPTDKWAFKLSIYFIGLKLEYTLKLNHGFLLYHKKKPC